jgi:hypothetical protein
MNNQQNVIVVNQKNIGLGIILGLFFGPLGLTYSSLIGAGVMLVISLPIVFITLGFGLLFTLPACAIWAGIAVNSHNKKLLNSLNTQKPTHQPVQESSLAA